MVSKPNCQDCINTRRKFSMSLLHRIVSACEDYVTLMLRIKKSPIHENVDANITILVTVTSAVLGVGCHTRTWLARL